ncbi:MAG: transporter [Luteolibacter sp.]
MKSLPIISAAALVATASAQDVLSNLARPDGHAPISIMADHTHSAGEWMLSYRYMFMEMDGMYQGSNAVSSVGVFTNTNPYAVTPTRMTMDMHMIGAMYAPTDSITLSAMLPYVTREMDHQIAATAIPILTANNGNNNFATESEGIGDLKLGALIRVIHEGPHHLHAGIGISLPTGSIGEKDAVPGPGGLLQRQLPATMQPGSGTLDFLPSLTYTYVADTWSTGVQGSGVVRSGKNAHGYRLGNSFDLTSWVSYRTCESVSLSAGINYRWEDELQGSQSDVLTQVPVGMMPRTVPTAFGENYGGQRIEALAGVNFVIPGGPLRNHRLALDVRVPLWQDRNGLSLSTDYTLTVGWQYAF